MDEPGKKPGTRPIESIVSDLGIPPGYLIPCGRDRAKIDFRAISHSDRPRGRLVLVSAITPTPAGEGKTTLSIGLAQGLARIGKKALVALREPSMGPLFGMKGGATGGGLSRLVPSDDINLLFNGDFPAISAANNLLAAALDNAAYFRKIPQLDPRRIVFPRVVDVNDRSLRQMVIGLGGRKMGVPRESHFDITAASEVMAILALSKDYADLKDRLSRILVGLTYDGEPITADSLRVAGAMATILRDAIHPNLVQTLEGVPAIVHCGPFANIAHGSSSILGTEMGLRYSDYTVTEAGFGFDLGAEKFFDITCRAGEFHPSICVLVVTVRALKMHGGVPLTQLVEANPSAVAEGLCNMDKHVENIRKFQLPVVVAINRFASDTQEEIKIIRDRCNELGVTTVVADVYGEGGAGALELARTVVDLCEGDGATALKPLYGLNEKPEDKIKRIASEIYGAEHVDFTDEGRHDLEMVYRLGYDNLSVCIAKTQRSLSDNPDLLGRPRDFIVTVRRIEIAAGAGFIVPLTGEILRMPGMPAKPAYERIDLTDDGSILGLS